MSGHHPPPAYRRPRQGSAELVSVMPLPADIEVDGSTAPPPTDRSLPAANPRSPDAAANATTSLPGCHRKQSAHLFQETSPGSPKADRASASAGPSMKKFPSASASSPPACPPDPPASPPSARAADTPPQRPRFQS